MPVDPVDSVVALGCKPTGDAVSVAPATMVILNPWVPLFVLGHRASVWVDFEILPLVVVSGTRSNQSEWRIVWRHAPSMLWR
jgi:hypothetical protein